jgi:hypothetical protein
MENVSAAFLDAVASRSARRLGPPRSILICPAEKLQYEGYLRREDTNAAIIKLASAGVSIKEIVRGTCHSHKLIRRWYVASGLISSESGKVHLKLGCPSSMSSGPRAATCKRTLATDAGKRLSGTSRRSQRMGEAPPTPRTGFRPAASEVPSARTTARLMTTALDHLSKADTVAIAAIEVGVPMLVEARILIDSLRSMIRKKHR